MKKLISVILCVVMMLSVIPLSALTVSAVSYDTTVTVGSSKYYANVGDSFTYTVSFTYPTALLSTAQVELPVDFSMLSGSAESAIRSAVAFPVVGSSGSVLRFDSANTFGLVGYVANFASFSGADFSTTDVFVNLTFKVLKSGAVTLNAKVRDVSDVSGNVIVSNAYAVNDANFSMTQTCDLSGASSYSLATPRISKLENVYGGVKITWGKVTGAAKYRVFKKNGTKWTKLADTTALTYTDTTASAGANCTYTVRCISSDGKSFTSNYVTAGSTIKYIAAPSVTKFEAVSNGLKLTWGAPSGASAYRVFRKNGTSWKKLGDTTSTSYVDTTAAKGSTYTYTVRCIASDALSYVSGYNATGWSAAYLATPAISKIENVNTGQKITWSAVSGASYYRIFVKNGTSWKKVADTASTSYTYTGAKEGGTSYTYTVRCLSSSKSTFTSWYNTSGVSKTFVSVPTLSAITNATNGVKLTWSACDGASKYRVFIKSGSSWKKLGDTASTSYTYTAAASNTSYTFTVRALDSSGAYCSGYNSTGWTKKFIATPALKSVKNTSTGVRFVWGQVAGAGKYRIFRKTAGGSWVKIADVANTKDYYLDTSAVSGTTYTYTVRVISSDAKSYLSAYNTTGLTITCKK